MSKLTESLAPLRAQIDEGLERYRALTPREQWALILCTIVVVVFLVNVAIVKPIGHMQADRQSRLETAQAIARKLDMAEVALRNGGGPHPVASGGGSLLSVIDQAQSDPHLGKKADRIQPNGDKEVRIWLSDVSFDGLVQWLGELKARRGIVPDTLDIERKDKPGSVDANLSLVRSQ